MTQQQAIVALSTLLLEKNWLVATAESCTGGGIATAFTDLAGSSAWFDCGFVTYSNHAKMTMLGVQASTLQQHGAVSEATVKEMVQGALSHSQAQLAVAVSGVAGPSGGSDEKPVGTVWFGWGSQHLVHTQKCVFSGNRASVREQAITQAIAVLTQFAGEN
ncbi:MAG: CinA family protein [Venatoribacter sp.]